MQNKDGKSVQMHFKKVLTHSNDVHRIASSSLWWFNAFEPFQMAAAICL